MKRVAAISLVAGALLFASSAAAQTPVAPPRKTPAAPESKPLPAATATPAPVPDNPNVDLVYGAFQRGEYKTAFNLATPRAQAGDPKAMTMLGEMYSNGFGIKRDYAKAV